MRRTVIVLLILTVILSTGGYSYASDKPSQWAVDSVNKAIELGIVPQQLQSNYQSAITREEFTELAVNSALLGACSKVTEKEEDTPPDLFEGNLTVEKLVKDVKAPTFTDTNSLYVKAAYILGIVNGATESKFNPDASITRQEAATLMSNYLQTTNATINYADTGIFKDSDKIASWARDGVAACKSAKVMNGTGEDFEPDGTYTREQAICSVIRAHNPCKSIITLRGKVLVSIGVLHRGWEVGKDWVGLRYPTGVGEPTSGEIEFFKNVCRTNKAVEFIPTRSDISLFEAGISAGMHPFEEMREKKRNIYVDSGYMVSTWNGDEYLLKYIFVPNAGLVSKGPKGVTFGRDKTKVEPKVITDFKVDPGPEDGSKIRSTQKF